VTEQPLPVDFIGKIRDYIKIQGGSCPSKMLVDHFNRYCKGEHAEQRTAEFKEMLKRVATLEKGGGPGRAKWVLKKEFGGTA
jgi:DNA excision repair protein ERCC-6